MIEGRDTVTIALAAAATIVAVAFAGALLERWLARRRPHELAWSVALVLFACGSLAMWSGAVLGWHGWNFRLFYAFGAVVNVPFLALGTVELLLPRIAPVVRAGMALACAFAFGVVVVAPFTAAVPAGALPQGSDVFGPLPRILAAVFSAGSALVVFAAAATSAVHLARGRGTGRLAAGNAVIAVGTVILSMSGLLNSALGQMKAFSVTLTIGIAVLFAGFLITTSPSATEAPALRAVA